MSKEVVTPPMAQKIPNEIHIHGEVLRDDYYWLKERDNPKVIDYLKAENEYTEIIMQDTQELQKNLFKEIKDRIKEDDRSSPYYTEVFEYYWVLEEGNQYRAYYRKNLDSGEEQLLLDLNVLAEQTEYLMLGAFKISPNEQYLAYLLDFNGSEMFGLRIKDLTTGFELQDELKDVSYGLEWGKDSNSLYYNILDEKRRPFKLFKHILGTNQEFDQLIYHEQDEAFFLEIKKSKDRNLLFMTLVSNTTTEVRYLDLNTASSDLVVVQSRISKMEYYIEHQNEQFLILTNFNAKNFKLMQVAVSNPGIDHWKEVVPHQDEVYLTDFEVFKDYFVLFERENGLKKIHIFNLVTHTDHFIEFPDPVYTSGKHIPLILPKFDENILRYDYTSFVTPHSVFDYNMLTSEQILVKQEVVLEAYDSANFISERVVAKSSDGLKVNISLVYRKGLSKNSENPLLLYGYGSYGYSIDVEFTISLISLLNRGFIYAIAHIRGGSEQGRWWYDDGKLFHKKNTFTDFIACAEHLIDEKFTSVEKLCIMGGSAGGLLMGAVVNMRPDLFKAVIAQVPFIDVITTMLDDSIPLTIIEYEEWGNPNNKEYYDYMKSYSPYNNIQSKDYPHILITAGLNDPRVQYWEPAKWAAKLRSLKTNNNLLLLKTNMGEGHSGKSGRYKRIEEVAFYYAFLLKTLNLLE